jgi:hypothetical protein
MSLCKYVVGIDQLCKALNLPEGFVPANIYVNLKTGDFNVFGSHQVTNIDGSSDEIPIVTMVSKQSDSGKLEWVREDVNQKSLADLAGLSSEEEGKSGG